MSRATVDLQTVRFFLGYGLIFFFQHVLTIVSVTVVLFFVDWRLALIALAITPLIVGVAYRYSHVSHPVLRDVQQKLADVATVAEESIVGVHVVKSFAQEDRRQAQFERASGAVFDATVRANRQRAIYVPLLSFLPLLAQAAVLLAAGRMVVSGVADAERLLRLQPAARDAGRAAAHARHVDRPGAARDRVGRADLRGDRRAGGGRRPPRRGRARRTAPGAIRFERVSFAYDEGRPVLHEIDLEIAAGRTVALIGHTGLGQDDARLARAALLRRDRGPRARRRRRRARRDAALAAARDRRHLAGSVPLLGDRPREHRLRRPRRHRRAGRPGGGAPRRRTSSSRSCRTATTR